MTKKICPTCHGNGYVTDADPESQQDSHIDCPTCDSQGEISPAVSDPDTLLQDMSKSFPEFWQKFTNKKCSLAWEPRQLPN